MPFAVSSSSGVHRFLVGDVAGCSSLSRLNANSTWGRLCLRRERVREERLVQAITLDRAVALAGGRPVSLLKIDAQGHDYEIVRAASDAWPATTAGA